MKRRPKHVIERNRRNAVAALEIAVRNHSGRYVDANEVAELVAMMFGRNENEKYPEDVKRRVSRDLNTLAKSGNVIRRTREFYAKAYNRSGLFGGTVSVKRRKSEYIPKESAEKA